MKVIVTNTRTGQAMGRTSISSPVGWVDPVFAATFDDADVATWAARQVFGMREALIGDVQVVYI